MGGWMAGCLGASWRRVCCSGTGRGGVPAGGGWLGWLRFAQHIYVLACVGFQCRRPADDASHVRLD